MSKVFPKPSGSPWNSKAYGPLWNASYVPLGDLGGVVSALARGAVALDSDSASCVLPCGHCAQAAEPQATTAAMEVLKLSCCVTPQILKMREKNRIMY